jgi:hypothetical protein
MILEIDSTLAIDPAMTKLPVITSVMINVSMVPTILQLIALVIDCTWESLTRMNI